MKIKCPNCERRFKDTNAVFSHMKVKHDKGIAPFRPENQPDHEESFADRSIQASIDHAAGIDNPDYDWLVEPYE